MNESSYKRYVLAILMAALIFTFADRAVLGIVMKDIQDDLQISDTELGMVSGLSFAISYSLVGVAIARWADCANRVVIIAVTAAFGSAMVCLCGSAATFLQLVVLRMGVAVGEAGCIPPSNSLLSDYFSREERPRAIAIYMLGSSISVVVGFFAAGWLNEFYGWRLTFVFMGAPGLVLAALVWLTLKEPRCAARRTITAVADGAPLLRTGFEEKIEVPTLRAVARTLWRKKAFRHVLFGFSVLYFFNYGILQWQPVYLVRSFGLETGQVGTWLAIMYAVGGLVGTYVGGDWASSHAAGNERLQIQAVAVVIGSLFVVSVGVYAATSQFIALGLMALVILGLAMATGPLFALVQELVPPRMRAIAIAIIYLFANLIGMGLGPVATGALSDAFRSWVGDASLRYALLLLCPGYVWAACHLWICSKSLAEDLESGTEQFEDVLIARRIAGRFIE